MTQLPHERHRAFSFVPHILSGAEKEVGPRSELPVWSLPGEEQYSIARLAVVNVAPGDHIAPLEEFAAKRRGIMDRQ